MELALIVGALFGAGLLLVIREFVAVQPDLVAALDRLATSHDTPAVDNSSGKATQLNTRIGLFLEEQLKERPGMTIPRRDLSLLGIPVHEWFTRKAMFATLGLAAPALLLVILGSGSIPLPVLGGLVAGTLGWFLPDLEVRSKAAVARQESARAIGAYIELVALQRAAGSGATESLREPAAVGQSWIFRRLQEALYRADLAKEPPWSALRRLGEELGLKELVEVAEIMRRSGEHGATVYEALRARARSIRSALLTQQQAEANAASSKLIVPVALTGVLFVIGMIYPALTPIVGGPR